LKSAIKKVRGLFQESRQNEIKAELIAKCVFSFIPLPFDCAEGAGILVGCKRLKFKYYPDF